MQFSPTSTYITRVLNFPALLPSLYVPFHFVDNYNYHIGVEYSEAGLVLTIKILKLQKVFKEVVL